MLLSELIHSVKSPLLGSSLPYEVTKEQVESEIDALRAAAIENLWRAKQLTLDQFTQTIIVPLAYKGRTGETFSFQSVGDFPHVLQGGPTPLVVRFGDDFCNFSRLNGSSHSFVRHLPFFKSEPYYILQKGKVQLHNVPDAWVRFDENGCGTLIPCMKMTAIYASPSQAEIYNLNGDFDAKILARDFEYPVPESVRQSIVSSLRQQDTPLQSSLKSQQIQIEQTKKP